MIMIVGPINSDENIYREDIEMGSYLLEILSLNKEKVEINNEVLNSQTHELSLGSEHLNEFNTKYLASSCFPALLTDAKGDSTISCLLCDVSKSETKSFAEKCKH